MCPNNGNYYFRVGLLNISPRRSHLNDVATDSLMFVASASSSFLSILFSMPYFNQKWQSGVVPGPQRGSSWSPKLRECISFSLEMNLCLKTSVSPKLASS